MKLLLADDEKIICESMASIIPWEELDIQLIGPCYNGIDALEMILDELPEIVITDIRMPVLSGLDLIERVSELGLNTQFILLSGYSEFEYAKKAMHFGVKHYLLKPCNETQVIDAIKVCIDDYRNHLITRRISDAQFTAINNMLHNSIAGILYDSLYLNMNYEELFSTYEPYFDLYTVPYRMISVHRISETDAAMLLPVIKEYFLRFLPQISVFGVYAADCFSLFAQDVSFSSDHFLAEMQSVLPAPHGEIQDVLYPSLSSLLIPLCDECRRHSVVSCMNNFHLQHIYNFTAFSEQITEIFHLLDFGDSSALIKIRTVIGTVSDMVFLRHFVSSLMLKVLSGNPQLNSAEELNWLNALEQIKDHREFETACDEKFSGLLSKLGNTKPVSSITAKICNYVALHLDDPGLTLKRIAEENLYMNVDYISKRFQKEMGIKFAAYVTEERIRLAKSIFSRDPSAKVQDVAEMVGCGNNPQYFSKLFRKVTGMNPSAYVNGKH